MVFETKKSRLSSELLKLSSKMNKLHRRGIGVLYLHPLMKRNDNNVFKEGEGFSGFDRSGLAEASITAVASPHVIPSIPRDNFVQAASQILQRKVLLPEGLQNAALLSPQLIVWWHKDNPLNEGTADFPYISTLDTRGKTDFTIVISSQTTKAAKILKKLGKPTIWGSWGHATPEERSIQGLSRGGPTNKHGHLHVTNFNKEIQHITLETNITAKEKLNHFAPWATIFNQQFGTTISRILRNYINSNQGEVKTKVRPLSTIRTRRSNVSYDNKNGFLIKFNSPIGLEDTFNKLIGISGIFESFYQAIKIDYADYYKLLPNSNEADSAKRSIANHAQGFGFTYAEAATFSNFVLGIKPTYGQLRQWKMELGDAGQAVNISHMMNRYERLLSKLNNDRSNDSLRVALVRDTITPPEQFRSIEATWPVHASATFIIDDFEWINDKLKVKSIKLFPGIASTEAGPERILGTILKR